MKNIDITEWLLNNHIDSETGIIMNGKQVFLADVLEKHLKEQLAYILSNIKMKKDESTRILSTIQKKDN